MNRSLLPTAVVALLAFAPATPLSADLGDSLVLPTEVDVSSAVDLVTLIDTPNSIIRSVSATVPNCLGSQLAATQSCPDDDGFWNAVIDMISQSCGGDDFIIWHIDCVVIAGQAIIHAHVTCLYFE